MKKKMLCMVLAGMMALSAAGCGGEKEDTSAKTETKENEKVQIEFWYGLGGTLGETVEEIIQEFNASQDEVEVVGVQQSGYDETKKLIQAAVASGNVPASALLTYQDLRQFGEKGVMQSLDDYIAADSEFNKEDIIESFMSYCISDSGETIGLPVYGTTQVMYYRKDAFEAAGIDPEEAFHDWDSLAAAAEKMAVKENGETVFFGWEPMAGSANLKDIAFSNGASVLSEDGTKVLLDSEEWVESRESIRKWIHDDEIMTIHFGGDGWEYWYKTIDDVMQNRAAGYIGSNGDQGDLDFTQIAAHIQPGFGDHEPSPTADSITCGIIAKASDEQKEAGFKWLSYLTGTKGTSTLAMKSGYAPVRSSAAEDPEFKKYLEENPQAAVPLQQAEIAQMNFIDPTGGKIDQAIQDAADLVEIENVPAEEALKKAQKTAQDALDEYLAQQN